MINIHRFDSLESTNDKARDKGFIHGDMVICDSQTRGRGQRGNVWNSDDGKNLTFSLVLEPTFLEADQQFALLQTIALATVDTLKSVNIDASIKWPNDIYVADRKVAGILIENDIMGAYLGRSIVGIGLNVNQTQFPSWIPNPTSMSLEKQKQNFDTSTILDTFIHTMTVRYDQLAQGLVSQLQTEYHGLLYLRDIAHEFTLPSGEKVIGTILHVEPSGELIIQHPDTGTRSYLFKEIIF